MGDFNEDVFIALVTDPSSPVDAATAYVASIDAPASRSHHGRQNRFYFYAGIIAGLLLFILWQLA